MTLRHRAVLLTVLRALFYTPETRIGGGAAVFLAHRRPAATRPTTGNVALLYTQERQSTFEVTGDGYTAGDAFRITGFAGYRKFPSRFYGVGNVRPMTASRTTRPGSSSWQSTAPTSGGDSALSPSSAPARSHSVLPTSGSTASTTPAVAGWRFTLDPRERMNLRAYTPAGRRLSARRPRLQAEAVVRAG